MTPDTFLADLATNVPAATKVFHRYGLDFCCNGRRPLSEACRSKGLDPAAVLAEIQAESRAQAGGEGWAERPLDALIDHILTRYHEPLREDLPRLLAMAHKVERVHGEKPSCPRGLAQHLEAVLAEVDAHLEKEEQILFPMIRVGRPESMSVQVLVAEHDDHAVNLRRTRELTGDLEPPPEACTTWRALYLGLRELERELMDHIHLENHVLFPRALREELEPAG